MLEPVPRKILDIKIFWKIVDYLNWSPWKKISQDRLHQRRIEIEYVYTQKTIYNNVNFNNWNYNVYTKKNILTSSTMKYWGKKPNE